MKFPVFDHYVTGTAVPVSALRSSESRGIGEFADLVPFGSLCKKCGIEVIQILPVNDTGFQVSPYSAVSAFALHPVYLRLQDLPGSMAVQEGIDALKSGRYGGERIVFREVLEKKLALCRQIFSAAFSEIEKDGEISRWIENNGWVKIYSVYKCLKQENGETSWVEWPDHTRPSAEEIDGYWNEHRKETLFHAWMQYYLNRQLREAAETLDSIHIALKGDLPILMTEDSADVWMHRSYFRMNIRAGAPPDMFSDEGQNWGFPIYNWENLEKDDLCWWRDRLRQAAKLYHAFRIDHVLGFFRIWGVPEYEESASMGYYVPYQYITHTALESSGFSNERISWLSKAHIHKDEITAALGNSAEEVYPYLRQIENEDLFLFDEKIRGGADIEKLPLAEGVKNAMKTWKKERALVTVEPGRYANAWHFTKSRSYNALQDHERRELHQIIDQAGKTSEKLWEKNGKKILSSMKEETDMLVCAEDLGVVPDCVPRVLRELGILSLKIGFWSRYYHSPGEPFIPVSEYPFESVATLSVHDSFVFREWWERHAEFDERMDFCSAIGIEDISKKPYTVQTALQIIGGFFTANSFLCVLQIQDFFAVDPSLRKPAEEERINTPGTVLEKNWTYRIPETVEELLRNDRFCSSIQKLTSLRRNRRLP